MLWFKFFCDLKTDAENFKPKKKLKHHIIQYFNGLKQLSIFQKKEKSVFNRFATHLKRGLHLSIIPPPLTTKRWPLDHFWSLFSTCLFVTRGWLRFPTVLQNSCEGTMLFFNKTCVSCYKRTELPSISIFHDKESQNS